MSLKLTISDKNFPKYFNKLLKERGASQEDVTSIASEIIEEVRREGDKALTSFTKKFDGVTLNVSDLVVDASEIDQAENRVEGKELDALKQAADRIEAFHSKQFPKDIDYTDELGIKLGLRWQPIDSVGLYVPGGSASYPSSVLMNAIPARVAGVKRRIMSVPGPLDGINPLVLAAAKLADVTEIYRIGGAQAIAALAFGTKTINSVDKIVGPGNSYVAAAKKLVYGHVGIDSIAGPSEILIVADSENEPLWIAYDLLAQAEHDDVAQPILITDDENFADDVLESITSILKSLDRSRIAKTSWDNQGAIIIVNSLEEAPCLINQLAPEHLELAVENPRELMREIRHAGAIFLGRYTPEAVGDYVAGPNHVLPTNRTARFSSGLSVYDFLKRTTVVECSKQNLAKVGPAAITLAEAEGLQAHAESIKIRLKR